MNWSPKGKWLFVRNTGIFVYKFVGIPFLDPDFEIWWYSYSGCYTVVHVLICFFYTVWYYSNAGEYLRGLLLVSAVGMFVPVIYLLLHLYVFNCIRIYGYDIFFV